MLGVTKLSQLTVIYFALPWWYSEREYQKGDEIAWYADGEKIVRNEYNTTTAYAFGKLRLPLTPSLLYHDTLDL